MTSNKYVSEYLVNRMSFVCLSLCSCQTLYNARDIIRMRRSGLNDGGGYGWRQSRLVALTSRLEQKPNQENSTTTHVFVAVLGKRLAYRTRRPLNRPTKRWSGFSGLCQCATARTHLSTVFESHAPTPCRVQFEIAFATLADRLPRPPRMCCATRHARDCTRGRTIGEFSHVILRLLGLAD